MTPDRSRGGLAGRIFAALALVVLGGGLTAWLVAGALGPVIFHDHMVQAGVGEDEPALLHAEEAFRSANALSLTVAVAAAVLMSLGVSLLLTARMTRSLAALSAAATHVATGRLDSRVPAPRMGGEFDELAAAFNHMASRLEDSEHLRRRLLADLAHELRTPVATLTAYLEGLEDGVETLTPQTVAVLRGQSARLARLAEDLAAVTHAESADLALRLAPVTPRALVSAAADAARERFAAAGVSLAVRTDDGLPEVVVDAERMAQVLGNLLDNALRHTDAGGQVTLSAEHGVDEVALAVTDTGQGIAPEHLPHVFERFYRADDARDRAHGGSGIGLAITRALVEAHGGTVSAHSAGRGRGTRFEVRLPVARPEPALS